MLDEGLEELGISALGLPYRKEGGDVEIDENARETNGTAMKRNQNKADEDEEGKNGEIAAKEKDDDEEEMDVDEKEEEEQTPTTTRTSRRSTRGGGKSTPRSDSKPSKKIPATESTKKKRAAKTKEVVVQKKPQSPPPPQQQEQPKKQERLWVMKEENLGPRSSCDAHPFFSLRCSCNELLASIYLTAGDYPKAVLEANELDATVSAYPRTLSSLVAHCEMVRGHALYSMGKYRDSVKAFTKAAERAKTPSFRDVATLCAALGELATGGTKGASKALDLAQPICRRHEDFLQNEEEKEKLRKKKEEESKNAKDEADDDEEEEDDDDDEEISFRPSLVDRAVALFVSGFAFLERGNQDGAKSRLSSALKLAHAKTKDTQLVAACLRALGSIASERSASNEQQQALDMLQSAFTLSKAQDDLDGQVEALRKLVESHEKKGSNEKEKKTLSDYLQKKEKQMEDGLNKLKLEENKINVLHLEKGLKDLEEDELA